MNLWLFQPSPLDLFYPYEWIKGGRSCYCIYVALFRSFPGTFLVESLKKNKCSISAMLIALVELAKWWINLIPRTTIWFWFLRSLAGKFKFVCLWPRSQDWWLGLALKAPKFWFPCIGSQDLNIKTTDHDANTIITNQQFSTAGHFKKTIKQQLHYTTAHKQSTIQLLRLKGDDLEKEWMIKRRWQTKLSFTGYSTC